MAVRVSPNNADVEMKAAMMVYRMTSTVQLVHPPPIVESIELGKVRLDERTRFLVKFPNRELVPGVDLSPRRHFLVALERRLGKIDAHAV